MKVKKISIANVEVDALPELLDKEKIGFQPIDNVNWEAYPYRPKVEFRIAHSDDAVLLHFNVKEKKIPPPIINKAVIHAASATLQYLS